MSTFSVDSITWKTVAFLLALAVLLPSAIAFAALWAVNVRHFTIAWLVCGFVSVVAALILVQLASTKVVLDGQKLMVGGGLYKVSVDTKTIQKDRVESVSLDSGSFALGYRVNGVGMPGFALGWFQPPKGKKLFVLVTDSHPLIIPTSGDFDIVVSPKDPKGFLNALVGR
jgi:hypothetical protein